MQLNGFSKLKLNSIRTTRMLQLLKYYQKSNKLDPEIAEYHGGPAAFDSIFQLMAFLSRHFLT